MVSISGPRKYPGKPEREASDQESRLPSAVQEGDSLLMQIHRAYVSHDFGEVSQLFKVLDSKFRKPITNYIERCLRCAGRAYDSHVAADIYQEVMIAVLRNVGRFTSITSDDRLLIGMAKNRLIDHLRRARVFANEELARQVKSPHLRPEEVAIEKERSSFARKIASYIEEHNGRSALLSIQDKKYREVAKELGICVGTVKSRVFAERKLLRENFADKYWKDYGNS